MKQIGLLLGWMALVAVPGAVQAQNPQAASPASPNPQVASPNAPSPPPEQIAPGAGMPGTSGTEKLSDRLAAQNGTLRPPAVDPGISAPLPSQGQGTMPVIPPPGSPGGNPNVVPK